MNRLSIVRPFAVVISVIMIAFVIIAPLIAQDSIPLTVEITGVDATQLPLAVVTANVFDRLRTPFSGLTADNFALRGALADVGTIVDVQNLSDDSIPFSVVLVIDTSSSMSGTPLMRAKEAATVFVENLRDTDPIALIEFNSDVRVVSDFTTDKAALLAAIDGLTETGTTALYDASTEAIRLAATAPTSRRVVVLLSDGQEDRGSESALRSTAAEEAAVLGVSVFTVGFGSVDQAYMQNLANATNAEFYLAPGPDQLVAIFDNLATALRSQYVITLNIPVALDGTEYPFDLVVTTPDGEALISSSLRAPIPVPIVTLPDLPTDPITEPTTILADVRADDAIAAVAYQLGDVDTIPLTEAPYTLTIDPETLPPGDIPLIVTATDETGDSGTITATITIAALPSRVSIEPDITTLGDITDPQSIMATVEGQTPLADFTVFYNGTPLPPEAFAQDAGLIFRLDPQNFIPGENLLSIEVTNEGGITSTTEFPFQVAALAPRVNIVGLTDGQQIELPTDVVIDAQGQVSLMAVTAFMTRPGESIELIPASPEVPIFQIDPLQFAPGQWTFSATAILENERGADQSVDIIIVALPPEIIVDGLQDGDELDSDRDITVTLNGQTAATDITFTIDGVEAAVETTEPFTFTLEVLNYDPGDHVLQITANTTSGQSATREIPFSVGGAPAASATAQAASTQAANTRLTATVIQSTALAEITNAARTAIAATDQAASVIGTQQAAESGTAIADASQTFVAQQDATQTQIADSTTSAVNAANVQSTTDAQTTQRAIDTLNVDQATADAVLTDVQNTQDAVQSTEVSARSTQRAETTTNAQNTLDARANATSDAATATQAEAATRANATSDAATATQAEGDARATATSDAATATQAEGDARATAISDAATAAAQAVAGATETSIAATAENQATRTAVQGTILARQATNTAAAESTAVRQEMDDARTATSNAIVTGTVAARTAAAAVRTQAAAAALTEQVTADAVGTTTADTEIAAQTQTSQAAVTPEIETPTVDAAETETQVAATPTVTPTEAAVFTAVAQAATETTPTITPTLALVEIPQNDLFSPDNLPLILVGFGILLILLVVIYLILTGRRQPRR